MTAANRQSSRFSARRSWLFGVLLCVCFRAVIPTGFMPSAGTGSGFTAWIDFCYGNAGSVQLRHLAAQPSTDAAEHGLHHAHDHRRDSSQVDAAAISSPAEDAPHHTQATVEHSYCLFAGVLLSGLGSNATAVALSANSLPTTPPIQLHSAAAFLLPPTRAPPRIVHATA